MCAKYMTAVPAVVLADQEGEVGVAALAPENGFVLHPARPALVLHCDRKVNAEFGNMKIIEGNENISVSSQKRQTLRRERMHKITNLPGIIHRWQGRVHTRKMLEMGMAQNGAKEQVTSLAFCLPKRLRLSKQAK